MNAEEKTVHTNGGTYVSGEISTGGGDFVGRDKIEQLIQRLEQKNIQGDYVERQEITNQFVVVGPEAVQVLVSWLAQQQGVDKSALQSQNASPSPHIARQIEEVQAAQQQAAAQGVSLTPQAAYKMGLLAVYRRDYPAALDYLQEATQADAGLSDAFEILAWMHQSRAVEDITHGDYPAAAQKLQAAYEAAVHTDPLDAQALAQRGFIAKDLATLRQRAGDQAGMQQLCMEAARLFEGALKLSPHDPSAYNGLGNVRSLLGELEAAQAAYEQALNLAPAYAAAWHDLAIVYEAKMRAEPAASASWKSKALGAWRECYRLAPDDPGFSAEDILRIGKRIRWLEELGDK